MPLLILTGYPSSGKSNVAKLVKQFLVEEHSIKDERIHILQDEDFSSGSRNLLYSSSAKEREHRAMLRSQVEKLLTKEDLIIVDALNYIKGYRYELYCLAKSVQTTYCVAYCKSSVEQCKAFNAGKKSDDSKYDESILDELVQRYEAPHPKNRWDFPLVAVYLPVDETSLVRFEQIYCALYEGRKLSANQSTETCPPQAENSVQQLADVAQSIIGVVVEAQKSGSCLGDELVVPLASRRLRLVKHWTMPALSRLKRQFLHYCQCQQRPVSEQREMADLFVSFFNNAVGN